jgi:2-hydroxy-3-keto-5-methylthiopentenyl-1-phosphate phosphatase
VRRDRDGSVPSGATTLVLDFDGTITEVDLLDEISSRFGDPAVFRELDEGLDRGSLTLQEVITREFAPVRAPLGEVVDWVLANARVRPGLPELLARAGKLGWATLILSSGFHELIEPVLRREGVSVEIKANRLDPDPSGWRVLWRDETVCPVCGEACKRRALPSDGRLVYVGDGYSDRCAALAADRVFAIKGLARYFGEEGRAYESFDDFHELAAALAS